MASKNRHNAAFVVGSVLGAVAGAAVALWKTPYSGEELRSKLTGPGSSESSGTQTYTASTMQTTGTTVEERSIKDKVLSTVEKTLAPIVGVELGKTANGSDAETTATPMSPGEMKVKTEDRSLLRRPRFARREEAEETSGITREEVLSGEERLTGAKNRIDAEKWAAAYGDGAEVSDAQATRVETPAARVEPAPATTTTSTESTTVSREAVQSGEERLTGTRSRINADTWAAAYGTAPESGSEYESNAEESEAQTGLGAKPAYPGSDQTGHVPVNREAPDDSIADVSRNADDWREESNHSVEDAASVEELTTPRTDRVPDSMQQHGEGTYHPFPKLGGKER